jgi:hypothetical protein
MISEIFSTSFLFSIAICIILVGGLFAYFNYRFSEQNHKIQSMLGLVSTMAEEMQYFRSKINSKPVAGENNINDTGIQVVPNFLGGNPFFKVDGDNELIEVSDADDDEDLDDDVEDDDNEDDDNEDDDIEDDDIEDDDIEDDDVEEDDVEDLGQVEDLDEIEDLENDDTNKKIITIDLGDKNDNFVIESEDIYLANETMKDNTELLNADRNEDEELNLENIEMSLKTISIDDNDIVSSKGKEDYKKMSLNKLRDIVCAKGLVVDASKLKKNELLKLLGDE